MYIHVAVRLRIKMASKEAHEEGRVGYPRFVPEELPSLSANARGRVASFLDIEGGWLGLGYISLVPSLPSFFRLRKYCLVPRHDAWQDWLRPARSGYARLCLSVWTDIHWLTSSLSLHLALSACRVPLWSPMVDGGSVHVSTEPVKHVHNLHLFRSQDKKVLPVRKWFIIKRTESHDVPGSSGCL